MIGKTVSHYKILEKLGGGGMGVVYKAEDTRLKRTVALKFLPTAFSLDPEAKARFKREAEAASALDHTNVCTIYDIDESTDGQIFICMACYEGETLKKRIEQGPLPLHDAIDIAMQVARGLQAAHEAGMVHRDVKPANIMVTAKGEAKILDFGLAKLAGQAVLTKTGSTVGTAAYASPEQTRGEEVDRRSDIFSFGVVLYEMITGHRPFRGEHEAAVLYSITNETPEPLARYKANVPDELQRVIDKSLAKEKGDRYQHIDEMLVDLRKTQQESPASAKSKQKTSRLPLLIGACLGIVALAILAYVFLLPKSAPPPEKSIAVLPFKNLSDSKEDEYFSEGITDDIIAQLSKITDLKVISRTSVMQYKGVGRNVREIGAELAVANVLEGSVRRSGNQVRIVAQLIDARNEGHLWAETYDKEMTQVFAIQSDVAQRIAGALQANLSLAEKGRIERKQTENTEAYQLYLKGRFFWNKRRLDDHMTAIGYFNQAIEKDSGYALAYAGLASTYALLPQYGLRPEDNYDKAEAAATRALELDPTLAEAHTVLAMIEGDVRWNWAEAEKQYKQAIELNPNYPTTHQWYSTFLTYTARPNEALVEVQRAHDLDPLSLIINMCLGDQYLAMRQFDKAIEQYRKTIALDPNFPWGYYSLGQVYEASGKFDKAIASYQKSRELSGSDVLGLANLGHVYARSGRTQEARRVLDTLLAFSDGKFTVAFDIAYVYAGLGEKEKTFEWLEKAYQERALGLVGLSTDPLWDDFRSDPRFEALLRKIGLPKGSPM